MTANGITTMEVRKINRHNIYSFIYEQKVTSKQQIVDALHLSLSTVSQNLKLLKEEKLIQSPGFYASTGGRKARKIQIIPNAVVALGVGILKDKIHLAAINLYGDVLKSATKPLIFSMTTDYCRQFGNCISDFIRGESWNNSSLIGAGIAIQGVISKDGTRVTYGRILNNTELKLEDLAAYLPSRSLLFHDSKAAAEAELWSFKTLKDAVVLLLNDNLGGALILDRKIYNGLHMYGGLIEHISLNAKGTLCYCGSRGCLETYLSADSLKKEAGSDLDTFFQKVRRKDCKSLAVWEKYLDNLAFSIRNLQVITDGDIVISGLLNSYMKKEDFDQISNLVKQMAPFPDQKNALIAGKHGPLAPAIGSALFFIKDWLERI